MHINNRRRPVDSVDCAHATSRPLSIRHVGGDHALPAMTYDLIHCVLQVATSGSGYALIDYTGDAM